MVMLIPDSPIAPFATGTGTSVTAVQTFTVPSGMNYLAWAQAEAVPLAPAVAEGVGGVVAFAGRDWAHTPSEFFVEIAGTRLEATWGQMQITEPRWWPFHSQVRPGSTIGITYEPLDALADNGELAFNVLWSPDKSGDHVQRLCSRETASTTATGESITISGGAVINDYSVAFVPGGAEAADDPMGGRHTAKSGAFQFPELTLAYEQPGIEATSGSSQPWLNVVGFGDTPPLNIPITKETAVITSSLVTDTTSDNADAYAYGIGYRPKVSAKVA